jgi:hypothetical protein
MTIQAEQYLGLSLQYRFNRTGDLGDINQSIFTLQQVISLTPDDHANTTVYLRNLGLSLQSRFNQFPEAHDRTQAIEAFQTAAKISTGSPYDRFEAAKTWASFVKADFSGAIDAYNVLMDLLPDVVWLGSTITQCYDRIRNTLGNTVSDAVTAAIVIQDYKKAVEWLEQGRSIIWGQLLNLRSPLDDLQNYDATLANRLKIINNQLEQLSMRDHQSTTSQPQSLEEEAQHHHRLAEARQDILNEIRMKPGFENFLLPIRFAQLAPAADDGPVVMINVHQQRCDALILKPGDLNVIAVPLTNCSFEDISTLRTKLRLILKRAGRNSRKPRPDYESVDNDKIVFEEILYYLWSSVVQPVWRPLICL